MNAADVRVAALGVSDLARVRALAHAIWPEAYAGIIAADRIGPMLEEIYSLEALRGDIETLGHSYWMAIRGGADEGFVSAYREARAGGDRVWIKKLYVLASARGAGLGRRLMDTAIAAFPGAASVALYVNDGNARAIDFYRGRGFVIEGAEPVRMGPFDFIDYVMAKPL